MKPIHCCLVVLIVCSCLHAGDDSSKPGFRNYSPAAESLVNKMVETMATCKSYSDDAVIQYKSSSQFFRMDDMPVSVSFVRNGRFKFKSSQFEVYADGKELTVYDVTIRRYTVKPVEKEFTKQVRPFISSFMPGMTPADLLVAADARKSMARAVRDMELTGYEEIDGFRCGRLDGYLDTTVMSFGNKSSKNIPVSIWVDMVKHLLRRIEIDQSAGKDDDSAGWPGAADLKIVLDVKNARLNGKIDVDTFKFDPPSSARKVDRFYTMNFMGAAGGASQFEMSGKKVPEFNLETTSGARLSDRELLGKVSVLVFLPNMPGVTGQMVSRLTEKATDLADSGLQIIVVWPSGDSDSLSDDLAELGENVTFVLDADSELTDAFPGEVWSKGIVLVGKDGVVQGKYPTFLNDQSMDTFKADVATLSEGKSLESAEEMSEDQRKEAVAQRSSRFFGEVADEVNEGAIVEAWSVTVETSGRSFSMSTGGATSDDRGFWVRTRKGVSLIGFDGQVVQEIAFQDFTAGNSMGWERFVVGQFRGRTGVVLMNEVPGDEEASPGWRPPRGAMFTAFDGSGNQLWELEVEANNQQIPQQVGLGNLDGRDSDELVFFHQGSLWIVDERGEVVSRRACGGWVSWLTIDDRDGNQRDEIYVGTNTGVARYDYKP